MNVTPAAPPKKRLAYIDNVRIFLSMLVVAHHAGQPYGSNGWWLYQCDLRSFWIHLFFGVNEAFFMGLFFLIAGYFHPGSLDRKGSIKFVLDRLWRFGVPVVIMVLGITPLFIYQHEVLYSGVPACGYWNFYTGAYLGITPRPIGWPGDPGIHTEFVHLWFIENLFIYGCVYALYRLLVGKLDHKPAVRPEAPISQTRAHLFLIALTLWLFASTFYVRIGHPVDDWQVLFGIWEIEYAHTPQYITMFVLGIIASRRNWFERVPIEVARIWLGVGLACVVVWMARGAGFPFAEWIGGMSLPAASRAMWESLLCVGFCVGLLGLARESFPTQNKLAKALSDSSFAVYIFHVPVVTLLQFGLKNSGLGAIGQFLTVTVLGILITFPLCHYVLRRLPILRSVL